MTRSGRAGAAPARTAGACAGRCTRDGLLVWGVLVWVGAVLALDQVASRGEQHLLGLGTVLLLLLALRGEDRATRAEVAVVVVFATAVELVFAGLLGVYVYRLDNVPAFVPPGHGLVYLAALAFGRTGWAARRERPLVALTLLVAGAWALWGVTLAPRPDVLGAFWYGCLVLFAWRGSRPLLYVGAFVVVSWLELLGTSLGTWEWSPYDPTGWIAIGNPPSGIAGGYAWFDAAALWLAPHLLARGSRPTGLRGRRAPARLPLPPAGDGPRDRDLGTVALRDRSRMRDRFRTH